MSRLRKIASGRTRSDEIWGGVQKYLAMDTKRLECLLAVYEWNLQAARSDAEEGRYTLHSSKAYREATGETWDYRFMDYTHQERAAKLDTWAWHVWQCWAIRRVLKIWEKMSNDNAS